MGNLAKLLKTICD